MNVIKVEAGNTYMFLGHRVKVKKVDEDLGLGRSVTYSCYSANCCNGRIVLKGSISYSDAERFFRPYDPAVPLSRQQGVHANEVH